MPAIVFTMKEHKELLRKRGIIYTVRLNNKKEGKVTIYFGRTRVARGELKKVPNSDYLPIGILEKYVNLSGFKDVKEWINHIDEVFLFRGLTGEKYSNLALYEVKVIEWFDVGLDRFNV